MFGFTLRAGFGVFRDPLTITQNMTLSIPPKTTVGGILAAILGLDYNDWFADDGYFDFGYSLILRNPIRKRSFAQNYKMDYTKISGVRFDSMLKVRDRIHDLELYENELANAVSSDSGNSLNEKGLKQIEKLGGKIQKAKSELDKSITDWVEKTAEQYSKPKPIFRELLINPAYLIFIHGFKYEDDVIKLMKNHESRYPLYMGNSEFPASYDYIEYVSSEKKPLHILDSFTGNPGNIRFEEGRRYTHVYAATRTTGDREYRDFRNMVISDKTIMLSKAVDGYAVKTKEGEFACEFI
jgi:CRISPR-associated protein Cas5h